MENNMEEVIKDSESGVGMMCSSPINRNDGATEKKMGKSFLLSFQPVPLVSHGVPWVNVLGL